MSQKSKLSLEEKVKIILKYMNGDVGLNSAAAEAGVAHETLRQWIMPVSGRRSDRFSARQEGPHVQPGIKATGGAGLFGRRRKPDGGQQKIWSAG